MFCSLESQNSELDASWIKLPDKIDFYLIFEFPEPWDRKIELSSHFPSSLKNYLQTIKDAGIKFKYLCVKPKFENNNNGEDLRVLFYKGNPADFVQFHKIELLIPSMNLLSESVKALVEGNVGYFEKFKIEINKTRDFFVCIHQERDQCCGKFGVEIFHKLSEIIKNTSNIRVWETSHMGGHRVGPTFIDMPSGRFWGYLDSEFLELILNETGDYSKIVKYYRGMMGLDRYSQIVHKSIFKVKGWEWFNNPVKSEILSHHEDVVETRIEYKSENQICAYTAQVKTIGTVSLPKSQCSKDTTLTKFEVLNLKEEFD